jgi:hypothetical protein
MRPARPSATIALGASTQRFAAAHPLPRAPPLRLILPEARGSVLVRVSFFVPVRHERSREKRGAE